MNVIHPLMNQCPNLYVEISYYTPHQGVEHLVQHFGPERILFGTGMPYNGPGVALGLVRYSELTDEARALIASGNLRRLMEEAG
jgi:predicted TIM-barrel fold metal-dependent hydrolase